MEHRIDEIERHELGQPSGQILKQSGEVTMGGDRFCHVQQQLQPIALVAQGLVMQHIVHGDGDQFGDLVEKLHIGVTERGGSQTAESDRAETPHRRGEGAETERLHADAPERAQSGLVPRFIGQRRDHQRLLMRPDPAAGGLLHRDFHAVQSVRHPPRLNRFKHMHLHDLLRRIVQHQADEIERGDSGQPLREVSKQGREVSV